MAELVLSAAAPITVVTALLIHVGWVRNRAYYGYFGIGQDLLRPSVQDYVLHSVDVTFGAVLRLVTAGLVLIWFDRMFVRLLRKRDSADWLTKSLVAVGVGVVLRLGPSLFTSRSASLYRPTTVALYRVLVVALFRAATLYAHELGRRAAWVIDANPAGLPVVTISARSTWTYLAPRHRRRR